MKVLGIIPSRYESSRFPGKPLIDIKGKSMIQRVYEGCLQSKLLSQVVIATDDERIFNHVKTFNGEVVMTAKTHQNGTERCGEVIQTYKDFDIIVNIQGDEPLIQSKQIDELIQVFQKNEIHIATLIKKINSLEDILNPNRIKVVKNKDNQALYFSRSPIPFSQGLEPNKWVEKFDFWKHIGIYAWRTQTLENILKLPSTTLEKQESLEQLRWMFHGYSIHLGETEIETPNIDVPEDLKKVLSLL